MNHLTSPRTIDKQLSDIIDIDHPSQGNVIGVNAHPDDEGTTAAAVFGAEKNGFSARIMCATVGEKSTNFYLPDPPSNPAELHERLLVVRPDEFWRGVGHIAIGNGHYLGSFPDGKLKERKHRSRFQAHLVVAALELRTIRGPKEPLSFVSLGAEGLDGHPDHIASHDTAIGASNELWEEYEVCAPVFGLDGYGRGSVEIPITDEFDGLKMNIFGEHRSQMKFDRNGAPNIPFFDALLSDPRYAQVLTVAETYTKYSPRDAHLLKSMK